MKSGSGSVLSSPMRVSLIPTFILFLLVFVPHVIALLVVLIFLLIPTLISSVSSSLSLVVSFASISCIVFSFIYLMRLHFWKTHNKSIKEIHLDSATNWTVVCGNKRHVQVELLTTSFVSYFLVILNFKGLNNRVYTAIIVPDSLSDQDFRRLRVRVKTV